MKVFVITLVLLYPIVLNADHFFTVSSDKLEPQLERYFVSVEDSGRTDASKLSKVDDACLKDCLFATRFSINHLDNLVAAYVYTIDRDGLVEKNSILVEQLSEYLVDLNAIFANTDKVDKSKLIAEKATLELEVEELEKEVNVLEQMQRLLALESQNRALRRRQADLESHLFLVKEILKDIKSLAKPTAFDSRLKSLTKQSELAARLAREAESGEELRITKTAESRARLKLLMQEAQLEDISSLQNELASLIKILNE